MKLFGLMRAIAWVRSALSVVSATGRAQLLNAPTPTGIRVGTHKMAVKKMAAGVVKYERNRALRFSGTLRLVSRARTVTAVASPIYSSVSSKGQFISAALSKTSVAAT